MTIGRSVLSLMGRERVVQRHFEKLANGAAILIALNAQVTPRRADWRSRRLDGFLAHVATETASDARKLDDSMRKSSLRGGKAISVYKPKIEDGKIDLTDAMDCDFYKICSKIDHAFRISVYSTLFELAIAIGASKIPDKTEKLSKLRVIVGESREDGLFCIDFATYAEAIEPFLKKCKKAWGTNNLKMDPNGPE